MQLRQMIRERRGTLRVARPVGRIPGCDLAGDQSRCNGGGDDQRQDKTRPTKAKTWHVDLPSSYVDQRMCSLRPTPERVVVFGRMRRLVKFSILLLLAGLATVVFVISAAAGKRQPTIQLVNGPTAIKVAGKGFAPGERVTLRAAVPVISTSRRRAPTCAARSWQPSQTRRQPRPAARSP